MSELCHIPPETLGQHHDLRGHAHAHRCCGKSLIGSALVRFGVRQHARAESISKRAPSTTRTSLRFRINGLRAVKEYYRRNCVRPSNVSDRLTAISLSGHDLRTSTHRTLDAPVEDVPTGRVWSVRIRERNFRSSRAALTLQRVTRTSVAQLSSIGRRGASRGMPRIPTMRPSGTPTSLPSNDEPSLR